MKSSAVIGMAGAVLAIVLGLVLIIVFSVSVYKLNNIDVEKYYEKYGREPHFEEVGIQEFFANAFRIMGLILIAGGALGFAGSIRIEDKSEAAFRLMIFAAVVSFFSLVGLVSMILFIISASKIGKTLNYYG